MSDERIDNLEELVESLLRILIDEPEDKRHRLLEALLVFDRKDSMRRIGEAMENHD